jgi:hypothetical protein
MAPEKSLQEPLRVKADGNRLVVDVPWRQAEGLQTYLRRREIGTTLVLEPTSQEARLEVWPGRSAADVQKALGGWHVQT